MIIKNKRLLNSILLLAVITTCCFSCETDLYETYDEYSDSDVVSIGSPDSLAVQSGFEKLLFKVYINADPKIKKGVITWNLGESEKTFNVDRTIFQDEVFEVEVDIAEGSYEFAVHMEDANGNKSNKVSIFTQVLGDEYRASLANRNIVDVSLYSETEAQINFTPNRYTDANNEEQITDELLIKTELTYTSSADGLQKTIIIDESEDTVIIPDFVSEGTFSYTTFYKETVISDYHVWETDPTEGMFPAKI